MKHDRVRLTPKPDSAERDQANRHTADCDRLLLKQLQYAAKVGSLVRNSVQLQESVREQRAALQGLRDVLARLRAELQSTRRTLQRPFVPAPRLKP